ncbi:MAG: hypothetical protein E7233_10315 [Lachnospiraceae bacterium]|nr:hypothetical protein [Lachnospiraceae bacterium]
MIFITGDTHRIRDIDKLEVEQFPEQEMLTKDDYLIIAGDFGAVWTGDEQDDEILEYHDFKNYTTLFIAGNHENHDLLERYPVELWNGGKVRRIRDSVLQLMNGQVYEIDGKTFFTMGGATSVDKVFRKEGISWWPQEEPSEEEYAQALENLNKAGNSVDYIITHTCPEKVRKQAFSVYDDFVEYSSGVEQFLDIVYDNVAYKKWFAGHIHIDREFREHKLRILYNSIVKI